MQKLLLNGYRISLHNSVENLQFPTM